MKAGFLRLWKWIKWPVLVLGGAYLALVIWDVNRLFDVDETSQAVAAIHAQKITMADALGTALPPAPNKAENDATVEGVDKNNNGIRDDVELAILNKYPNSAKIRAAELQYAKGIQALISKAGDADTWIAAAQERSRGYDCVTKSYPRTNFKDYIKTTALRTSEVEGWVVDTNLRSEAQNKAEEFAVDYMSIPGSRCDINLDSLPN